MLIALTNVNLLRRRLLTGVSNLKKYDEDPVSKASAAILDWVTVEEFCQRFPNFPEKTIRWQLTSRAHNGLAPYVQLIGKTRYISITGYATWLNRNH